ncbi:MAG TPA: VOC family protein [Rhodothermales bacterium]|nr:VOC family protein [Rhodothermales bacterium]
MTYLISGIQQVGIGVSDVDTAWAWYRRHFGMDVPVFREAAEAPLMTRYTGGTVQSRDALLALNLQGGGGMEVWQFTSRTPQPPAFDIQLGNLGLFAPRIKAHDVQATYQQFQEANLDVLGEVKENPAGQPHFFIRDPLGLVFDIVEGGGWFAKGNAPTGGPSGCLIGVSDIDRALPLYQGVLGYDAVVYDETGMFPDLHTLPGGDRRVRRVLLAHSQARQGPFSELLGPSQLELVQALDATPRRIFEGRFWGDLGFIHLCFDIKGMDVLKSGCAAAGFPFTIDSQDSFDMGEAAGRFSYIEDPDGTLIEFVETHKMPVLKKLGWYLDLRKRPPAKPLPQWMIKALGLSRVRD